MLLYRDLLAKRLGLLLRQALSCNSTSNLGREQEARLAGKDVPRRSYDSARESVESENDTVSDNLNSKHVVACLILFGIVGTLVFIFASRVAPSMSESMFTMSVILIYVATSVGIDLFISSQKEEDDDGDVSYSFDPICVVITTEVIKLVISAAIYLGNRYTGEDGPKPLIPPEFAYADVKWLAVPAVLFGANNILIYYVILKNDISTFGIFRDTTILWTALMWKGWFRVDLGSQRLVGIFVIFVGMAASEVSDLMEGSAFTWTFLWVCLLTLVNSLAGVSNEFALKRNYQLDLNLQNIVLYMLCIAFASLTLLVTNAHALNPRHFYDGFTAFTFATSLLQAFGGLIVSRVLKYADAVTKTVAACLRGPTLILIAPLVLSDSVGAGVIACSFVIAFGCWVYLRKGPIKAEVAGQAAGTSAELPGVGRDVPSAGGFPVPNADVDVIVEISDEAGGKRDIDEETTDDEALNEADDITPRGRSFGNVSRFR